MKKNIVKLLVLAIAVMGVMLAFASCGCAHEETEAIPAVEATCTEAGATAGTKCKACGEVVLAPVATEATGHSYKAVGKVEATCTEDGHEAGSMCDCGAVESGCEKIAAAHKPADIAAKEPTCTEDGAEAGKRCSVCAENLEGFAVVPATGHTLNEIDAIAPSCTVAGSAAGKKCANCDYSEGFDYIEATGHTAKAVDRVAPTCTEVGYEAGVRCEVCQAAIEGCTVIDALGHTPDESKTVVITAAGLGKPGSATSECSVCKAALDLTLPALLGGEWNYTSDTDTLIVGNNSTTAAVQELVTEGDKTYVKVTVDNPGLHPGSPAEGDKATKNNDVILSWKPDGSVVTMDALTADNQFVFKTKVKFDEIVTKWTPAGTQYDNTGTTDKFYQSWLINFCLSTNTTVDNSSDNFNIYVGMNPVLKEGTGIVEQLKVGNATFNIGEWVEFTFIYTLNATDANKCDILVYMGETQIYSAAQAMKTSVPGNPITDFRIKFKNTRVYDKFVVCFDDSSLDVIAR